METTDVISGFSKLSKQQKISYLQNRFFSEEDSLREKLTSFWHPDAYQQKIFDEFSENTLTNFFMPYGVVPNFLMNGKLYCVPMVIEESSVVAAASRTAKFWMERGGFKAEVIGTEKIGQVHFIWKGESEKLFDFFKTHRQEFIQYVQPLMENMQKRGGGLKTLELLDKTDLEPGYYQLKASFETCDAMGANFINSVLEALAEFLKNKVAQSDLPSKDVQVVMAILSNYTPNCRVRASLSCSIDDLSDPTHNMSPNEFAEKFARAVRIAEIDTHRATTHNKGILNGIDAVILATGNDFRAVEACVHTYAYRDGAYRGLTRTNIENGMFEFSLEIPLAVGTVGGLTSLHPMAKFSLELLGRPGAQELMKLTACMGLAQNFGALRSLVTSGIQKGHMKMHLMNILRTFEATDDEAQKMKEIFKREVVSFSAVRDKLSKMRNHQSPKA